MKLILHKNILDILNYNIETNNLAKRKEKGRFCHIENLKLQYMGSTKANITINVCFLKCVSKYYYKFLETCRKLWSKCYYFLNSRITILPIFNLI